MKEVVDFFEKALDEWFLSNKSTQPKGFKFVSQSKDANFEFIEIWYPNPEGPLDGLVMGYVHNCQGSKARSYVWRK